MKHSLQCGAKWLRKLGLHFLQPLHLGSVLDLYHLLLGDHPIPEKNDQSNERCYTEEARDGFGKRMSLLVMTIEFENGKIKFSFEIHRNRNGARIGIYIIDTHKAITLGITLIEQYIFFPRFCGIHYTLPFTFHFQKKHLCVDIFLLQRRGLLVQALWFLEVPSLHHYIM